MEVKNSKKKEIIYETGLKLFSKYGFTNVSIDKITKTSRIAKGTFYLYYKSKEELYNEILFNYKNNGIKRMEILNEKLQNSRERLYYAMLYTLVYFNENSILFNMLIGNEYYYTDNIRLSDFRKGLKELIFRLLKGIDYNKDFNKKINFDELEGIFYLFLNILKFKNDLFVSDNFEFCKKVANVIIDGLFINNSITIKNLSYEEIKDSIKLNNCPDFNSNLNIN